MAWIAVYYKFGPRRYNELMNIKETARIKIRGLKRKVNRGRPLDSYPLISGDSYRYSCQYYFKDYAVHEITLSRSRPIRPNSVFLEVEDIYAFIEFLFSNGSIRENFSQFSLIVHNGDNFLTEDIKEVLSKYFLKIFSVNLLQSTSQFRSIPIGLENWNLFTNGVPSDWNVFNTDSIPSFQERSIKLLQSFSIQTNILERSSCLEIAKTLGASALRTKFPSEYRNKLRDSKYVLSPRGNGLDCHRTWEALYAGAIPVVRRNDWCFNHLQLPVLIVQEWQDLISLDLSSKLVDDVPDWDQILWNDFFYG